MVCQFASDVERTKRKNRKGAVIYEIVKIILAICSMQVTVGQYAIN